MAILIKLRNNYEAVRMLCKGKVVANDEGLYSSVVTFEKDSIRGHQHAPPYRIHHRARPSRSTLRMHGSGGN